MLCIEAASCTSHWKFKSSHVFHYKRLVVLKYQCCKGCLLYSKCCQLHCHFQTFINSLYKSEFKKTFNFNVGFCKLYLNQSLHWIIGPPEWVLPAAWTLCAKIHFCDIDSGVPRRFCHAAVAKPTALRYAQCSSQSLWEALSRGEKFFTGIQIWGTFLPCHSFI